MLQEDSSRQNQFTFQNSHKKPLGSYIPIFRRHSHGVNHFLALGPRYAIFVLCFGCVNLFSVLLLHRLNKLEESRLYYLVYLVIWIYLDIAWLACALINPGVSAEEDGTADCQTCDPCFTMYYLQIPVKESRVHCKSCQTCVDGHKHHCFMTGNCIGKNNFILSYFLMLGIFVWIIDLAATLPYAYYVTEDF